MQATDRISRADHVVSREVSGETVLLDLESGTYFGLNPVGGRVWDFLGEGGRSKDEITAMLVEEYDVGREQAVADVSALLADLRGNGLLQADPS